jgi:hypothetical protein
MIFIIIFVSLYSLDFIYTLGYQNGTPRNKVAYLMQNENDTIDYIFIGSSRVDNTIDSEVIESITGYSAINLGFQGAKIDDYLTILMLLQDKKIKFKKIFIQVDYVYNLGGNSEILRSELMPFIGNTVISKALQSQGSEYYKLKYIPFYRYLKYDYKIGFREVFNTVIGNKNTIDLNNGYFPKYGYSGQELKSTLPNQIANENISLNKIDSFAKNHNINIIYFIAPFCPNTKNLEYSTKLKDKLPIFLDYSNLFPYQDNYFYDCNHLNNEGAHEFSRRLAEDIIELECV